MTAFRIPAMVVATALAAAACKTDTVIDTTPPLPYIDVVEAYEELFVDVQMGGVFPDSKTFVDMVPVGEPADIVAKYREERSAADFDLGTFVKTHFTVPPADARVFSSDPTLNLDKHIERLWAFLRREEEDQVRGGTLLPLPHDYIVPGGRFREIYYWDSYFTMQGLLADHRVSDARNMVDNMAYLIDTYGFIPNGNRSYYLSRSQPPFFAPMVALLAAEDGGDATLLQYLPTLQKEYDFWMRGADDLTAAGEVSLRVARLKDGLTVNRFHDNYARPRPEGYHEDSTLAANSDREPAELYEDLRAACESGWDFSSRWLTDPDDLGTIRTGDIAPVDLNSLMYFMEEVLAKAYGLDGDTASETDYAKRAYERRRALLTKFWSDADGTFMDYDLVADGPTEHRTLAMVYPLYFGIATEEQAASVAEVIKRDFLMPGGLVTTLNDVEQQWDAPNGWAPLQWMAIKGLRDYGHADLAREIAQRWLTGGKRTYAREGKVVEKYNVADTSVLASGGEYPNQDGFGWSNGIFAKIIADYPELQ